MCGREVTQAKVFLLRVEGLLGLEWVPQENLL